MEITFFFFFPRLQNEDHTTEADDDTLSPLKECSSYNYAAGVRTGCDLQADIKHAIHILFNGTQKNMTVRNTFRRVLLQNGTQQVGSVQSSVEIRASLLSFRVVREVALCSFSEMIYQLLRCGDVL